MTRPIPDVGKKVEGQSWDGGRAGGVVAEPLPPVAVGMRIAAHPPHRSGHGRQSIRLLPRVLDGKPSVRPRVADEDARPQDSGHALQSLPVEAVTLGPPAQRPHPQALQPVAKDAQEPARPRDGEVVEPALTDPPKPFANLPDVVMPAFAKSLADARQGPVDPFRDRFATKPETASPGRCAEVRETREVECLRPARPATATVRSREPSELHEAGLVRVEAEAEAVQPFPNVAETSLRIPLALKPDHDIVRMADNDRFTLRDIPAPLPVEPQIEHAVQEDVRQGRGDHVPLRRSHPRVRP